MNPCARIMLLTLAFVAVALSAACGNDSPGATTTDDPSPSDSPDAVSVPRYGVAGLIPRHFPDASASDWEELYQSLSAFGGLVGVYTNWSDAPVSAGSMPKVVGTAFGLQSKYRVAPIIALGVARDSAGGVISTVNWSDGTERARFLEAVSAVADKYRPPYLAIGVEVNRLWQSDPAAFDAFVTVYAEAYDAIKKQSPQTKVFTIFQLELMKGRANLSTGKPQTAPQWELLTRFAGKLDVAGFTTYPFLAYETPGAIPADYFAEAATRSGLPIALTEIGWPSAPLSAAPASAFGGSPEEQVAFVHRLRDLLTGVPVQFALWSFPNDLGAGASPPFESVSLRANDGTPKPAMVAWQEMTR